METIDYIKRISAQSGACGKAAGIKNVSEAAALFFSAQGKEFCQNNGFPSLQQLRKIDSETTLSAYGIHVDKGAIRGGDCENTAIAGDTQADLRFSGADYRHTIIVMHGAKAKITLRDYAVAEIINIGGTIEVDADKTSIRL